MHDICNICLDQTDHFVRTQNEVEQRQECLSSAQKRAFKRCIDIPMMQNSVKITVPTVKIQKEKQHVVILNTVFEGTEPIVHNDLEFRLTGICYEETISPGQYAFDRKIPEPF